MISVDDYVLQIALWRGLLRREQLESALGSGAGLPSDEGAPSDVVARLVSAGALDPDALARAVAGEFGLPFIELSDKRISGEALGALPRAFVLRNRVCPVELRDDVLVVAVADPLAVDVIDELGHTAGRNVRVVVAAGHDLQQAIERHYETDEVVMAHFLQELEAPEAVSTGDAPLAEDGGALGPDAPVIRLAQTIIHEAIRRRASDIHLEPLERRFRVRYRIDGVLVEADPPPKRLQLPLISRLKIMANISIAEKRVPQDGRIQIDLAGLPVDLRVSTLPTVHGESIVMRILDQRGLARGLPELGFLSDDEESFKRLISAPDGMLLVTGPTGSGKTTTLYSCLHDLNRADRKIITVEDPVEYRLSGINQVSVQADIGMTFAAALRAMLRQAPNVVMVGEIRDRETADISINAALTGHLVFSTLHTNDAPGAVTRLLDLGAKSFLVAAALRAVMAQRLVRRICPACRRAYTPAVRELHALGLTPSQLAEAKFAHGAGCPACQGTGYRGRLGIFEIFLISDEVRGMVYDRASAARLRARARQDGMRTLRDDGVRKVLAGLTTIEEVVSATVGDID
ncbi:MAG: type II/IV secretion system protein [Opitutae bacterium]|nr:type II/IV secretion system protein [Opitutae bacterium]